jgi:lipoprotein-anchoring transpeptidase ErfK/SrfK
MDARIATPLCVGIFLAMAWPAQARGQSAGLPVSTAATVTATEPMGGPSAAPAGAEQTSSVTGQASEQPSGQAQAARTAASDETSNLGGAPVQSMLLPVPQAALSTSSVVTPRQASQPAPIVEAPVPSGVPVDVLRTQLILDRLGFSPGLIDGIPGRKTRAAMERLAAARPELALPITLIDEALAQQFLAGQPLLRRVTLTAEDFAQIGPWPEDWLERSRLQRMHFESLESMLAERGHCTVGFLRRLNPGVAISELQPGDSVVLPNVLSREQFPRNPKAGLLVINLEDKTIDVFSDTGGIIAFFHCSIARDVAKRPVGEAVVVNAANEPNYLFDPAMWPDVKHISRKLIIPPGPRNPVGLAWIGLSIPGYGIHGTPQPENIGKTGSHGCFRLTNWDAQRLLRLIRVGTTVRFIRTRSGAAFDLSVGRPAAPAPASTSANTPANTPANTSATMPASAPGNLPAPEHSAR